MPTVIEIRHAKDPPTPFHCPGKAVRDREVGLDHLGALLPECLCSVRLRTSRHGSDSVLIWVLQ